MSHLKINNFFCGFVFFLFHWKKSLKYYTEGLMPLNNFLANADDNSEEGSGWKNSG